ncbi:unnamed protein product [Adineta steineri]|uniref:Uncharacterized protein n=2 Tax=Adineta steineri TaxID=433720 RepID=A0A819QEK6_9BILA|nr:unnamed protein product [Adineta steineri]
MSTITHRSYMGTMNFGQMLAHEARLNGLHRLFKTHYNVPEPSLVLQPYLFLGNCISAHDVHRLSRLGIHYILNVAKRDVELCPYYSKDMRVLTIDLRDDDRENIICIFDQAFAFIDEARRANSRVLVHCSHGQSRSPAIVIAYLMRTYHVPLEQCLTHVVKARPCVIPNDGFLKQLILFDRVLVEKRRHQEQQQNMGTIRNIKSAKAIEIPIKQQSPDAPHPVPPPLSTESNSSPSSASSPPATAAATTTTIHISSVDSSCIKLLAKNHVQPSKTHIHSPKSNIQLPKEDVQTSKPKEDVQTSKPNAQSPKETVHTSKPNTPSPKSHTPSPKFNTPSPKFNIPSPKSSTPSPRPNTPSPKSNTSSLKSNTSSIKSNTPSLKSNTQSPKENAQPLKPKPQSPKINNHFPTSNIQPSGSTKSMQIIPIDYSTKKERSSEKVKRVPSKKASSDNEVVIENRNKKIDKYERRLNI